MAGAGSTSRRRIVALAALAAAAASFACAQHASAAGQIIFERTNPDPTRTVELWTMNEDGSNEQLLIEPTDLPSFPDLARGLLEAWPDELGEPSVDPNGDVLLFDAWYDANPNDWDHGVRSSGVYRMGLGGEIVRLSMDPLQADDISHYESEPEPTGDGRFLFNNWLCHSLTVTCSVHNDVQSLDDVPDEDGDPFETRSNFGSACDDDLDLGSPSPNPVNPARVAYVGCTEFTGGTTVGQLIVAGANNTAKTVADTVTPYYNVFKDPSWRADGQRLLAIKDQGSTDAIYMYSGEGATKTRLLQTAANNQLQGPRFIGTAKVVFEHRDSATGDSDVYSIPATCVDCTLADATQLTDDGASGAPAWAPDGGFGADDIAAPVAAAPAATLAPNTQLPTTDPAAPAIPVKVAWPAGTDDVTAKANLQYKLQRRIGAGAFTDVGTWTTARTRNFNLRPNELNRFRVLARDEAGNVGVPALGDPVTAGIRQESHADLAYAGTWTGRTADTTAYGGFLRSTTAAGARATLEFAGRGVAVVAPKAANLGAARITLKRGAATIADVNVDLSPAAGLGARRLIFTRNGLVNDPANPYRLVIQRTSGRLKLDAAIVTR